MSGCDELVAHPTPDALQLMGVERIGAVAGALNGGAEPPRKRAKLPDEPAALRRRILEGELLRLRALRECFTDQLSELYFLQAGGNMMDYAAWRKRPPAPALLAFLEARRPAGVPAVSPPPPAAAPADEAVAAARREAAVAARVQELARAGLWPERRLPRVLEPPRPKAHWDYLLEEMAWLAQDFAHERKWKKQAAKKCARAVQKYFQDKALAAQKAEKAQELQLKKIASFAAKEIRTFWTNVEKLVEWKRTQRLELERKRALDEQLGYIVERTERYSRQLAANLQAEPAAGGGDLPSDYSPDDDSADDERTIAEQERAERTDAAAELDDLRRDADLDVAELARRYAGPPPPRPPDSDSDADTDTDTDTDSSDAPSGRSDASASALGELVAPAAEEAEAPERAERSERAEGSERLVEAAASLAASLQPTGTTLSSTAVGTRVPALLRGELREYQHVGLHWLATMYARRLNGILADEMGLGKTVQTIALLAHLAERHEWGPHLVVAPTSVVLNWEMEFKKWCPAFKILTYYGTIKERKLKRVGWTKANSFHVCITSYKLVVQDHQSFRRKRWKYLILDEAQNIKNFKSQRWQMLLNFQTERRLLLTGTPLQNSLLELWSLMHFLMPDVFASHSEFREWFGEVAGIAEGSARHNDTLVRRLHEVLRPFLLRRLKRDVERQMPRKYEHVLMCRLARRQRFLYDDFMARARTRDALAQGNLLGVINVLMQLRKVCNHPDLFEPRPVASPLHLPALRLRVPALALLAPRAAPARLAGDLATLEAGGAEALAAHRARHLAPPASLRAHEPPAAPRPPPAALRLHLRLVPRAAPPGAAPPPAAPRAPPAPARRAPSPPAPARPARRRLEERRAAARARVAAVNERRCWRLPLYGADLRAAVCAGAPPVPPRDVADVLRDCADLVDRFCVCWQAARACAPALEAGGGAGGREWRARAARVAARAEPVARAALALLHAPAAKHAVAFPHPALLQYDCGKLQTLDALLRRLKAQGHRVLIFTQMTRVLDVLEAFLSMHGHAYLRLDGATRVDTRQHLVDRFNADPRVFAFILSTRSGGVGLNLTGADSVVFYDSDWNPTMDAQAQDRCHRIGQTRDVHVYRLVTAATVEENILRKAEQKRALGDLAIDAGHFTTSYLRGANIAELFGSSADGAKEGVSSEAGGTEASGAEASGELDAALAAAEDEADAAAASAARHEATHDLAEFDESLPLDEEPPRRAADPLHALMEQLSPVEKYAMRVVESSEAHAGAERTALHAARRQRSEWRAARARLREREPSPALTYGRAAAQTWVCGEQHMPTWGPPTPPAADTDVYCEPWARALYRAGPAPDALLPPAPRHVRARSPRRARHARARPAPPSLFERCGRRARARPAPPAPPPHAEWAAAEDAALRRALRLQRLPPEPPAALAPNWEWCADLVADAARAYRSPRACRERHDALADPRRRHRRPARRRDDPRPPLARLDALRAAAERRRAAPRRRDEPPAPNAHQRALLADHGVAYDAPPSPRAVAARRADRIAKEKQKAAAPAPRLVVPERRPRAVLYRAPLPPPTHPAPLKILHHPPAHHAQGGAGEAAKLQLQQVSLRRAPAPGAPGPAPGAQGPAPAGQGPAPGAQGPAPPPRVLARAHSHVVVAHLAPARPPTDNNKQ